MSNRMYSLCFLTSITISVALAHLDPVGYGGPCDPNKGLNCDHEKGLQCRDKVCSCWTQEDMEYNATDKACNVLVGGECTSEYAGDTLYFECVENAYCEVDVGPKGTCLCGTGYSPSNDGKRKCGPSHGGTCTKASDCNSIEGLVCSYGVCGCPSPLNHYFDVGQPGHSKGCFKIAGVSCDPEGVMSLNEGNAGCHPISGICSDDKESSTGYSCKCNEDKGFFITKDRQCKLGYMQGCRVSSRYDTYGDCNKDAGLLCFEKKCQCEHDPDQVWEKTLKRCASIEGKRCNGRGLICAKGLECVVMKGAFDIGSKEGICGKEKAKERYKM